MQHRRLTNIIRDLRLREIDSMATNASDEDHRGRSLGSDIDTGDFTGDGKGAGCVDAEDTLPFGGGGGGGGSDANDAGEG